MHNRLAGGAKDFAYLLHPEHRARVTRPQYLCANISHLVERLDPYRKITIRRAANGIKVGKSVIPVVAANQHSNVRQPDNHVIRRLSRRHDEPRLHTVQINIAITLDQNCWRHKPCPQPFHRTVPRTTTKRDPLLLAKPDAELRHGAAAQGLIWGNRRPVHCHQVGFEPLACKDRNVTPSCKNTCPRNMIAVRVGIDDAAHRLVTAQAKIGQHVFCRFCAFACVDDRNTLRALNHILARRGIADRPPHTCGQFDHLFDKLGFVMCNQSGVWHLSRSISGSGSNLSESHEFRQQQLLY